MFLYRKTIGDGSWAGVKLAEDLNRYKIDVSFVRAMLANWNPFPDRAYCEKVGWKVNSDGTVDTPGGIRIPTRDLCEVKELEELYQR